MRTTKILPLHTSRQVGSLGRPQSAHAQLLSHPPRWGTLVKVPLDADGVVLSHYRLPSEMSSALSERKHSSQSLLYLQPFTFFLEFPGKTIPDTFHLLKFSNTVICVFLTFLNVFFLNQTWSFLKTKVLARGVMLEVTTKSAGEASGRCETQGLRPILAHSLLLSKETPFSHL